MKKLRLLASSCVVELTVLAHLSEVGRIKSPQLAERLVCSSCLVSMGA
jgi:hypothetical protein